MKQFMRMHPKNPPPPSAFGQLIELIGEEPARYLARCLGGISYCVPRRPTREGPLVTALGEAAAQKVCDAFGGDCLYIPKFAAAHYAARNQAIVRAYLAGTPARDLSRQFGLTERRIWAILKETPVAPRDNRGDEKWKDT